MTLDHSVREQEDKKEKVYSMISLGVALIFATLACLWYYNTHPPDDPSRQRMRLFFKNNKSVVMEFIRMPPHERELFAAGRKHPFYQKYVEASVVEKNKINALIHNSVDYNPRQYWFNLVFQWVIEFFTLWFLGKMTEAVVLLVADKNRRIQRK